MMREILFRGKDADTGFWCFGDLSFNKEKNTFIRMWTHNGYVIREVISETVGQFTGFYDKNGHRIFDGDILSGYDEDYPDEFSFELVQWTRNGWYIGKGHYDDDLRQDLLNIYSELIGNRWDNPEMLEVGK